MTLTCFQSSKRILRAAAALAALLAARPALATDYIYWTNYLNGTISRAVLPAGPVDDPWIKPAVLGNPAAIVTDGVNVYWVDNAGGSPRIGTAPLSTPVDTTGTNPYVLSGVSFSTQLRGLSIDTDGTDIFLFVADYGGKKLTAVNLTSKATTTLLDTSTIGTGIDPAGMLPGACRIDSSASPKVIYWGTHTGQIYSTTFTYTGGVPGAGTTTQLATGFPADSIWDLSYTGGNLYAMIFANFGDPNSGINLISGGIGTVVSNGGQGYSQGNGLRAWNGNFYYYDAFGLQVMPVGGASPTVILTPADTMVGGITTVTPNATVVSLTSLTAKAANGKVTVSWTTGSEVATTGFNVHRATTLAGPYTRVNAALIPATGTNVSGASYAWTDAQVAAGTTYFYKLEDVDAKGQSTFHGPVSALAANSAIAAFQATPASIFLGGGSLLAWTVNGASALLDGTAVTGASQWVAPTATRSYTLTAGADSAVTTVTVKAFGLDDIAGLAKAWGHKRGEAAYDPSYDLNGDGQVDDTDAALCFKGL